GPLRDRMEIIQLAGYTREEKHHIARRYLVPRQIERNGLTPDKIDLKDDAIDVVIVEYTREAGVRNLERELGSICRKVARDSAQAALSFVRSHANTLNAGLADDYFQTHDLHVHVPAGATPKDGPSAGVAMATALASLISGRLVREDTAMTGELTLIGQVLPIGGLKEKALAAQAAGLQRVIAPKLNQ